MKKKILSVALTLMMIVGMLPTTVNAAVSTAEHERNTWYREVIESLQEEYDVMNDMKFAPSDIDGDMKNDLVITCTPYEGATKWTWVASYDHGKYVSDWANTIYASPETGYFGVGIKDATGTYEYIIVEPMWTIDNSNCDSFTVRTSDWTYMNVSFDVNNTPAHTEADATEIARIETLLASKMPNMLNEGSRTRITGSLKITENNFNTWLPVNETVPDTETPDTEVPDTETPDTETPDTEVPDTEVPDTETPDTETPDTETPDTEIPDTETPEIDSPVVDNTTPSNPGSGSSSPSVDTVIPTPAPSYSPVVAGESTHVIDGKDVRMVTTSGNANVYVIGDTKYVPTGSTFKSESVTTGATYDAAKKAIANKYSTNANFSVFELNLFDDSNAAIHQLGGYINVTMPIPSNMDIKDGETIRAYRLESNGKLTKLDTAVSNGSVTFATNHFSTYILVEESTMSSPKTGDPIVAPMMFAALMCAGGAGIALKKAKDEE